MMAAELFKKTLAGYEASLSKGESVSLSRYCKTHHVNCRGLRYWMKKQSLDIPKIKLGKEARHSDSNHTDQLVTGTHHMVPLLIQSPIREETARLRKSSLKGVNITIQNGLVVCINEISCVDLAELILSCNTR
jgi:hypothetical protein